MGQSKCPDTAKDRVDGVSGWGSPLMNWIRKAFHPYLIILNETWSVNPSFTPGWPLLVRKGTSGETLESHFVVFNDGLRGNVEFFCKLTLRWDSAVGPLAASTASWKVNIEHGFAAQSNFSFILPDTE